MSDKSAFGNAGKNSSHKNHALFLKIMICLKSFFFHVFLISVGILNNFLDKWFLFLIHFVSFHSFFLFSMFSPIFLRTSNVFARWMTFCFTLQILKYVFQSHLRWNFVNILRMHFIVLIILLHFLSQYDLNSSCDCFYKIIFFTVLHNQFHSDFAYVSIFSTSIKHENMRIFSHNFFNFVTSIFFHARMCLNFVQMLFNKMFIKIDMWSND